MKPGLSHGTLSIIESSCGYPDLYYFTYLSRKQEQFAKTPDDASHVRAGVTNLLILLTMLPLGFFIN